MRMKKFYIISSGAYRSEDIIAGAELTLKEAIKERKLIAKELD